MGQLKEPGLHYVEVMCESLLQGMFTVLIAGVVWLLLSPRPMPKLHRIMFLAGIVMWMLSCAHLGLVIQQVTSVVPPLRNAQAQVSIATIELLMGDSILIWRVWAVWGRNYWMTLLPFLLMLAAAGVRFAVVASIAGVLQFQSDVSSELIVANTVLCTGLIAGRIWYLTWQNNKLLGRSASRRSQNAYRGALMMIIESGVLITLDQLLSVILDKVHSDGIHTILDTQTPITGMLPTLIVLFVYLDLVPGDHATQAHQHAVSSRFQAASGPTETTITIGSGSRRLNHEGSNTTFDDHEGMEIPNEKKPAGLHYTTATETAMV